ncbi:MAG: 4-hydroxy-3-methylbut-2-enyl diphosphate reductase [Bacteroidales bacterium]|nr:4-hydroxy-3-methylbut-2-enyl diphosphate reductase [Bacteroidales bacterium]
MTVEIDRNSGFCGGVIRAIDGAEKLLAESGPLFSLGAIVHNEAELGRLREKGLRTVDSLQSVRGNGRTLLIRAHGEPPQTYRIAEEMGWKVVDFTCPVVLKIQKSIREARAAKKDGQIVIFGKIGHAEVLGLVGQVDGDASVVENLHQLQEAIASGKIDLNRPVDIFSQTTKSPVEYEELCTSLAGRMASPGLLTVHNTICRQVASRHDELSEFASVHDVVVFVSGRESSNGRVLSDLCKSVNPRTYVVGNASELDPSWFSPGDNVGVCGATSTPKWLLEEVAVQIKNLH